MKIENITIKRRQISFSDKEFADINNARRWLGNALHLHGTTNYKEPLMNWEMF